MHLVGAHDDGRAAVTFFFEQVFHHLRVHRVERAEGFIDDHYFRFVHQRGDQLGFLLHTLAELFNLLLPRISQVELFQIVIDAPPGLAFFEPFQSGEINKTAFQLNILVKPAFFRQITDTIFLFFSHGTAQYAHCSGVRFKNIQHDTDGGGLTCAVWS